MILLLVIYALRMSAIPRLPHADVLLVDLTGLKDDSRGFLYTLLDEQGLSHLTYYSMGIEDIRLLPSGGYRFIILWGHSGINDMATTEPYSLFHYVGEQLTGEIGRYQVNGKDYFSLEPGLVEGMVGRFPGTTIMLMGCNTLTQTGLAQAFVDKGASTVIGWHGTVPINLTDMAVITFFEKVLAQQEPTGRAVAETSSFLDSLGIVSGLSSYATH